MNFIRRRKTDVDIFLKGRGIGPINVKSQSFLDRGLRDWANRRDTAQARGFSEKNIATVAFVLADLLSEISPAAIPGFAEVRERVIQTALEQKLVTYRDFQPIRELVERESAAQRRKVVACFATKAGLRGMGGETSVLISASTLINWQSAHDSHTNDKKKELCGRAVALRYSWDSTARRFLPRPGVKKQILVVDGTWKQSDLDALVRAGWDEIFYPDEIDKLVKAIV